MIKIRLHIYNENDFMNDKVSEDLFLPCLPRKGDFLYMSNEIQDKLESKIKSNIEIANDYSMYFYYGADRNKITENDYDKLSLDDCIIVHDTLFQVGEDIVHISLSS